MYRPLILLLGFVVIGCSSQPTNTSSEGTSETEYYEAVQSQTQKRQIYDGFINILDVRATLLTTQIARAQLDQYARMYQWDETTFANEKSKTETNLSKGTDLFVSFFVPERKHDDLAKANSRWKIFLDVAGKRYEGKAKRIRTVLAEVKALYPDHTRWGTPYQVTFPVPTSIVEAGTPKLTITGPLGSATLQF